MRKLLSVLLMMLLLGGCMNEREDYYIFSFGDYTLTPGYDNMEYARLIFDLQLPETIGANSRIEKNEVYFWDHYLCDLDLINESKKEIPIDEAIISSADFYLSNYPLDSYKISDIELSDSVKENCEKFSGKYVDRNGYACIFGKQVGKKDNIVILYGDIFAIDQDKLYRIKIYVE